MDLYLKVKDWDIKSYQMGNIKIKDKVINLRQEDCDFAFAASQLNKTTELEKKFFEAFGIKPEEEKYCYWECKKPELENIACDNTKCEYYKHKIYYPEITDRHYLELILIYSRISNLPICYDTVERFKEAILEDFIENSEDYKHQVQELFKGE